MACSHLNLSALAIFLFSAVPSLGVTPIAWTTIRPPDTSQADSAASKSAMIKVSSIIFPSVNLKDADIRTVLEFLKNESRKCDPEHIGVRFELKTSPLPVEAVHNWPNGDLAPDGRPLVEITMPATTLEFLLGFVVQQTDLRYKFVNGVVVLSPFETEQQRSTKKAVVLKKVSDIILPATEFHKADIFAVLDVLIDKSKDLDPEHTGINFQAYIPYGGDSPNFTREVSLKLPQLPLNGILSLIGKQTHLEYAITSKGVFFTEPDPAH